MEAPECGSTDRSMGRPRLTTAHDGGKTGKNCAMFASSSFQLCGLQVHIVKPVKSRLKSIARASTTFIDGRRSHCVIW